MESIYDENLNENKFYKRLQTEYKDLFEKAISDSWVICVPCCESLENYDLNEHNLFTHILIPSDELPETHFQTLAEQEVRIFDKTVKLEDNDSVPVLFSEVFYADGVRYEVYCLERPLNYVNRNETFNPRLYSVKNLRNCIDLLSREDSSESVLQKLDEIIKQFLFLSTKNYFCKSADQQINFVKEIYRRCLQVVLQNENIRSKMGVNRIFVENVQIAVESYVLHNMYSIIMKGLVTNMTSEIGSFNKILRNLANIQLQNVQLGDTLLDSISTARAELSHLCKYTTVLGKLTCFKRCINLLSNKSSDKLSIDELLPILVFLVVKSGITTWVAQLKFIKEFSFSQVNCNYACESSFLIATMEAIISYIQSDKIKLTKMADDEQQPYQPYPYVCNKSRLFWKTGHSQLLKLFQHIYNDNLIGAFNLLDEQVSNEVTPASLQYCHPLCSCDKCEKLFTTKQEIVLTVNTVNESGHSPIHVAACYGKCIIVERLLSKGAEPNCVDFFGSSPLHCAAAHGYQNIVLLLISAGAKLSQSDDDGNQPLHLASANGQIDCVKALLYFAEQAGIRLDVNAANKDGDTALHLAVKYYQKEIVEILLNYNANPFMKNKYENTVFELTESLSVKAILNEKHDSVNLLDVPNKFVINSSSVIPSKRRISKDEYGLQPCRTKDIRIANELFRAAKYDDLKTLQRYLGFGPKNCFQNTSSPTESSFSYKCHPLCRCEKCNIESPNISDEETEEFPKMKVVSPNICDSDGFTVLHIACKYGSAVTVQFLLDIGAKINVRTFEQLLTPLHIVCIQNQLNIAKILLSHTSCRINLQDQSGNTALHYASMAGNMRMVELLLKYTPDRMIRNARGKTPLNEAEENLSYSLMRILKSSESFSKE